MRKVILSEWVSLDGYVADKKGGLDFFGKYVRSTYAEPEQVAFLQTIDTIVMGRKTYQQFAQVWPQRAPEEESLAAVMNKERKIIFSNTLTAAPWAPWPAADIVNDDVVATIKQLKTLPGKNIVVWASISIAKILMQNNL